MAEQGITPALLSRRVPLTYLFCRGAHTLNSFWPHSQSWKFVGRSLRIVPQTPCCLLWRCQIRREMFFFFLVSFWTGLANSKSEILFRKCTFICSLFCPYKCTFATRIIFSRYDPTKMCIIQLFNLHHVFWHTVHFRRELLIHIWGHQIWVSGQGTSLNLAGTGLRVKWLY